MNKKKQIIIIVLGAFLIAWMYYSFFLSKPEIFEVERGDIIQNISAFGKIIASDEVKMGFEVAGRVDKIYISSGTKVKEGDILMSLNSNAQKAELKKSEAQIELAKAKLSQLLAGTRNEELDLFEAQVETAKINLNNALQNFENLKIKLDNKLTQTYQSAVDVSDSVLLTANNAMDILDLIYQPSNKFNNFFFVRDFSKKSDAEWQIIFTRNAFLEIKNDFEKLKENSSNKNIDKILPKFKVNLEILRVSLNKTYEALETAAVISGQKSIEEFISDINRARAGVNSIQTELLNKEQAISLQKITNQNSLSEAENLVNSKRALLAEKEGELALKKAKPRDVEIAVYEAQIKEAGAFKALTAEKIKNMNLTAPISGIVKNIYVKKGSLVESQKPVVSLILISDFQVESELSKKDAEKIKVGDKVDIILNTEKESGIEGNVVNIEGNSDKSKVFIAFLKESDKLKLGMDVKLKIRATVKKGVLVIPQSALIRKDNYKKVILLEGSSKREVKVETGEESEDKIEILSGLYEGDIVIIK